MNSKEREKREDMISGLRDFAAFLEANDDAPLPYIACLNVFVYTKKELVAAARAIGGKMEKSDKGDFFCLTRQFGSISYDINIRRERVCERVIIGTQIVPASPERILPAIAEHTEEIVEWHCSELLK